MTVDGKIGERLVRIELCRERFPRTLEVLKVFFGPPVLKLTFRIEQRSLIVEAMTDLVTDDRADGTVVMRGIGLDRKSTRLNSSH